MPRIPKTLNLMPLILTQLSSTDMTYTWSTPQAHPQALRVMGGSAPGFAASASAAGRFTNLLIYRSRLLVLMTPLPLLLLVVLALLLVNGLLLNIKGITGKSESLQSQERSSQRPFQFEKYPHSLDSLVKSSLLACASLVYVCLRSAVPLSVGYACFVLPDAVLKFILSFHFIQGSLAVPTFI